MQENKDDGLERGIVASENHANDALLPKIDFAKRPIPADAVFFKLPSRIGTLLAAHSDWVPSQLTPIRDRLLSMAPASAAGIGVGVFTYNILKPLPWPLALLCFALPISFAIAISLFLDKRFFTNFYIGSEGFAYFKRRTNKTEMAVAHELRWDEISGLRIHSHDVQESGEYKGTHYQYNWLSPSMDQGGVAIRIMQYNSEKGLKTPATLMFCQVCEVQWTQRLLQQLDQRLDSVGYELFQYSSHEGWASTPCIEIYRDKVIFRVQNGEQTYHFGDVARLYWQATPGKPQKKIDKVAFFVERAKAYGISVDMLCNSSYFVAALGKVLEAKSWDLPA